MLQILINFLQVTGIAVFINVKWTNGVLNTLGVAGKKLDFPLPISKCINAIAYGRLADVGMPLE